MKTQNHGVSSMYKKLIASLVIVLVLLAVIIMYFTLNKVEIDVYPKLINTQSEFYVNVLENSSEDVSADTVKGIIEEIQVDASETFMATGEKEVVNDEDLPVVGKVTLFNEQNVEQTLVRRTRLLTPDEKLFRLTEQVDIPANGSIEVEVYYDPEETDFTKVDATTFTIPGLSQTMQEVVYAESNETLIRPGSKVNFVQKSDIENAVQSLSATKLEEIVDGLKVKYGGDKPVALAYLGEVVEQTSSIEAGEVGEEFTLDLELKVIAVILDHDQIYSLIDQKLQETVGEGYKLVNLNFDNLKYYIDKYDLVNKSAQVEVVAEGNLTMTKDHSVLDKNNFIGLDKEQLVQYFQTINDIKETEIRFYPSWLNKVPSMSDHIYINIK